DDAIEHRLAATQEYQLSNQVWQETWQIQRRGEGVPKELDPEVLRILRFLLRKSQNPAGYVNQVRQIYEPTKDFRVLEALGDGVPGHSAEAVYGYLAAAVDLVTNVHEEATCDALVARIASLLEQAKNDTDKRALRLLLISVESRAAAVPKADPLHETKALAAL